MAGRRGVFLPAFFQGARIMKRLFLILAVCLLAGSVSAETYYTTNNTAPFLRVYNGYTNSEAVSVRVYAGTTAVFVVIGEVTNSIAVTNGSYETVAGVVSQMVA